MALKKNNTVVKNNILNEMRGGSFSLVEYRLFCIYLSRINPYNKDSNRVRFSLSEYAKIMGLDRPRKEDLEKQAENIVTKTVKMQRDDGGFSVRSLFITFDLLKDDEGIWQVDLTCHPELTPYLFENQKRFFKYKVYNTIFLKSYNQMRIYELLKQYEKIGKRTITLEDLREYLGIEKNEYPVWAVFSRDVLKKSQKALAENTDITFTYKALTKVVGGKRRTTAVEFIIAKNDKFIDQLRLDEFLNVDEDAATIYDGEAIEITSPKGNREFENQMEIDEFINEDPDDEKRERLALFAEALPSSLTLDEVDALQFLAREKVDLFDDAMPADIRIYHYLSDKVALMKAQKKAVKPENYFGWLRKAVQEDWK